jgi:hypothetical protein
MDQNAAVMALALVLSSAALAETQPEVQSPRSNALAATVQHSLPLSVSSKVRWAVTDAEQPRDGKNLKLLCETHVGEKTVSFLSLGDGTVLIAAFTDRPLRDPTKDIWLQTYFLRWDGNLTAAPYDTRRPSATADWAYVYDQNGDGRIDHLAFLIGPLNIEPPDAPADLPVTGPDGSFGALKGSLLKKWFRSINKFGFWQAIDENGDGKVSWLAIPARKKSNGWFRGWAVISQAGASIGPACQILDRDGAPLEACAAKGTRNYESTSRTVELWSSNPQIHLNEAIKGEEACHIGRGDLRRMMPSL